MAFEIEKLRYLHDYPYFCAERLFIVDKNSVLRRLQLNNGQLKINAAIERQKAKGMPVRIALLKARQYGGSTFIESVLFNDTILRPYRNSLVVAHSLESAEHLRSMSDRYYVKYEAKKPDLKRKTEKWWQLNHPDGESSFRIDTSENISAGHSFTIQNLHLSEIAKWKNTRELMKGLLPTVPNSTDTMIFMESTGSGVGDWWYDKCQVAQSEGSEWEFVFVGWHEIEEYQLSFSGDEEKKKFEKSLDEEEKILLGDVTLEQLKWRRREVNDTYKGDIDSFRQQYPFNPDEAFLSSGRPVFDTKTVRKQYKESKEGESGFLEYNKGIVEFLPDRNGVWTFWEKPEKGQNLYCLGADFSEGKAVLAELGTKGGDYSAARVKRRDKGRYVATFHARLDPDLVAEELWKASIYFGGVTNIALLPEQNAQGGGEVVIRHLKKKKNVRMLKTPIIGRRSETKKDEYGWETMRNTKRLAIDTMKEHIRKGIYEDPDKKVWYECSTYVYDEQGRSNAQSGKFDDLVMATALAEQADLMMPVYFGTKHTPRVVIPRDMDVPINWKPKRKTSQREIMESNYVEY